MHSGRTGFATSAGVTRKIVSLASRLSRSLIRTDRDRSATYHFSTVSESSFDFGPHTQIFNKIPACIGQTDGRTEIANQDRAVSKMHCGLYGPYLLQQWYDIRSICLITPVSTKSLFINVKDNTLLFFINIDYWVTF